MDRLDRMLALVRRYVPDLRLVHRAEVRWMRAAAWVARPVVPDLNTRFTTVIGNTVYLPRPVDEIPPDHLAATLAHELVHQLDQQRWGSLFMVSYGVLFPSGRSMRAYWERRAYAVDLLLAYEGAGDPGLDAVMERLIDTFSGPSYLWMWAGEESARAYLMPIADAVRDGSLARQTPYDEILSAWRG